MQAGAITGYFDVAQITLYGFWIFFAGLIYYLHREDKREGYPLETDLGARRTVQGFPEVPSAKTFVMAHGHGVSLAPRQEEKMPIRNATPVARFEGAPLSPLGNPLVDGIGPAAWCGRSDVPELSWDDAGPMIVPLRAAREFFLTDQDPNPIGMTVLGADRRVVGVVREAWIDRSEVVLRYLETELDASLGGGTRLIPVNFCDKIDRARQTIFISALLASQFVQIPTLAQPDQVTLLEEDKILGYFGGGRMYATPKRQEPLL